MLLTYSISGSSRELALTVLNPNKPIRLWNYGDRYLFYGLHIDLAKSDPGPFLDLNPKEKYGYG
jgi:hypothetical protein